MTTIPIRARAGAFAENKDTARNLRETLLLPALAAGETVVLDFAGVEDATQSFIHALISEALRRHGPEVLDRIEFRSCAPVVRKVIGIVADYMQEGLG